MTYQSMSRQELESLRDRLLSKYNEYKADGIKLDMARGKPVSSSLIFPRKYSDSLQKTSSALQATVLTAEITAVLTACKRKGAICRWFSVCVPKILF